MNNIETALAEIEARSKDPDVLSLCTALRVAAEYMTYIGHDVGYSNATQTAKEKVAAILAREEPHE